MGSGAFPGRLPFGHAGCFCSNRCRRSTRYMPPDATTPISFLRKMLSKAPRSVMKPQRRSLPPLRAVRSDNVGDRHVRGRRSMARASRYRCGHPLALTAYLPALAPDSAPPKSSHRRPRQSAGSVTRPRFRPTSEADDLPSRFSFRRCAARRDNPPITSLAARGRARPYPTPRLHLRHELPAPAGRLRSNPHPATIPGSRAREAFSRDSGALADVAWMPDDRPDALVRFGPVSPPQSSDAPTISLSTEGQSAHEKLRSGCSAPPRRAAWSLDVSSALCLGPPPGTFTPLASVQSYKTAWSPSAVWSPSSPRPAHAQPRPPRTASPAGRRRKEENFGPPSRL